MDLVGYASAYSFKYSPRPGTPAAGEDRQVPEDVKSDRLEALQQLLNAQQYAFNRSTLGARMDVLVERRRPAGQVAGRSPYMAVNIEGDEDLVGRIVSCTSPRQSRTASLDRSCDRGHDVKAAKLTSIRMEFEDNGTLALLTGEHNANLAQLEQDWMCRSTASATASPSPDRWRKPRKRARARGYYRRLGEEGAEVPADSSLIRDVVRWVEAGDAAPSSGQGLETWKKKIIAKTPGQTAYLKLLRGNEVVFGLGPAGTGKTYLAVAKAVESLKKREVERIVLSRLAVEAGERLGFLPGDMKEKVDPYLRPLYDALYDMMPADKVDRMLVSGEIEIAPLAFMRGRTLSSSYVIIDEAQNTTPVQMKMVLTRLGGIHAWSSPATSARSTFPTATFGLADAVQRLDDVEGIGVIHLSRRMSCGIRSWRASLQRTNPIPR